MDRPYNGFPIMATAPSPALLSRLSDLLGPSGFTQDPDLLEPWLADWRGRYRGVSCALLSPATPQEVQAIVRLCAESGTPLVPQGGNTSMSAGATPPPDGSALILSMRRMRAIRTIAAEAGYAVCEAGVILSDLHDAALAVGRRFPLSLAAKGSATVGGLISTNAGGTQVLRFGTMRGLVRGIEAVLPDGSLFNGLAPLKKDNRGYDLRQLLIGAEGTLGIVTAASLTLVPTPVSRTVAWLGLKSPEDALTVLRRLEAGTGEAVESFELVPDVALQLVLQHIHGTRAPIGGSHAWHVLVEAVDSAEGTNVADRLEALLGQAMEDGLVQDAAIAASDRQAEDFWRLRESISEAERADGPATKHDISVEVDQMPRFVIEATQAAEARFPGTRVIAFGHLGDGNVHFNVRAPAGASKEWVWQEGVAVTSFVHDLVTEAGGSISAEHGIGQMRLAELARLSDPARLGAMRAIKHALDPKGIMNPGKLVPLADQGVRP